MSHFGNIGHHLIVAIIDHIPNGWVMFNGDMTNDPCVFPMFNLKGRINLTVAILLHLAPKIS